MRAANGAHSLVQSVRDVEIALNIDRQPEWQCKSCTGSKPPVATEGKGVNVH